MRKVNCVRCNVEMEFVKREYVQLGKATFWMQDYNNIDAGALETEIYMCPQCEKYEFFKANEQDIQPKVKKQEDPLKCPQVTCPSCGKDYDMYYYECPHCGYKRR